MQGERSQGQADEVSNQRRQYPPRRRSLDIILPAILDLSALAAVEGLVSFMGQDSLRSGRPWVPAGLVILLVAGLHLILKRHRYRLREFDRTRLTFAIDKERVEVFDAQGLLQLTVHKGDPVEVEHQELFPPGHDGEGPGSDVWIVRHPEGQFEFDRRLSYVYELNDFLGIPWG